MKKRDKFWLNKILWIFTIVFIFLGVSFFNIVQFNNTFISEEKNEIDVFEKQAKWVIVPLIEKNDTKTLQAYFNDFKDEEDFSLRLFDKNKNLIASSSNNTSKIAINDSRFSISNFWKTYRSSFKDKKLEYVSEFKIKDSSYYLEITLLEDFVIDSIIKGERNIAFLFLIWLMILVLGLIQIFSTVRKSFNTLEDSVIEIAKGELDTRIEVPKNGLLEELALSIITMTKKLKLQIKRLSRLEQYKTEFLQNITHEIKTPITAISSAVELIETQELNKETRKECFSIIKFQTSAIDKLIKDILSLCELDLKQTEELKQFKAVDVAAAAQAALEKQGIFDIKVNFINPKEEVIVNADEEFLITAISNILSNAIKYSSSKVIDIIIKKDSIEIKDYGVGIEQIHIPRIFEKFYRVDKSRSRQKGGGGLGLSIVKNIINLHGWNIEVKSEINKGTSFKIIFNS